MTPLSMPVALSRCFHKCGYCVTSINKLVSVIVKMRNYVYRRSERPDYSYEEKKLKNKLVCKKNTGRTGCKRSHQAIKCVGSTVKEVTNPLFPVFSTVSDLITHSHHTDLFCCWYLNRLNSSFFSLLLKDGIYQGLSDISVTRSSKQI